MIKTLVQSIKLTGFAVIALAVIMGAMMGGSSLWSQFQGWQTEQFRSQFAFLSSAKGEFQQMAHKYEQRNLLSSTDVDWKAILQAPKVAAITLGTDGDQRDRIVRRMRGEIDPLMKSLDASWIPQTAEEVNLVVGLHWGRHLAGRYSDGSSGYQETCQFAVYERSTGALIIEGMGVGSLPRPTKKGNGKTEIYGGSADADVVKLIKDELEKLATAT